MNGLGRNGDKNVSKLKESLFSFSFETFPSKTFITLIDGFERFERERPRKRFRIQLRVKAIHIFDLTILFNYILPQNTGLNYKNINRRYI